MVDIRKVIHSFIPVINFHTAKVNSWLVEYGKFTDFQKLHLASLDLSRLEIIAGTVSAQVWQQYFIFGLKSLL